jgi:hypothetical protein
MGKEHGDSNVTGIGRYAYQKRAEALGENSDYAIDEASEWISIGLPILSMYLFGGGVVTLQKGSKETP